MADDVTFYDAIEGYAGRLSNVVAESADGQITFDEIPLANEQWGFFSG